MSQLEEVKALPAYRLTESRYMEELKAEGMILEHRATKARIFLISNDDENKVFCISFRTPPADDCGLPHILEHSVLCGSEKFPVKDPFVELVKGSLNTFLNAITYPDKTVYPVASCNGTDFQNLMDVYMDAVLHPNIYKEEKIFRQEGWHYEIEDESAPLEINGVVYNEMKGAYSSPESILESEIQKTLFPDTCYGRDSGGDPEAIPELSYETFLAFHSAYYHPSNSFIYLYGDMNMAEKLTWLDEEYLSRYEERSVDSEIRPQKPFLIPADRVIRYPVPEDDEAGNAYLSVNTVVGGELDPVRYLAFNILEYTLLDAPGAPLKQALLDAGIGRDILGGYESGFLQPYFSVIAKDARKEQKGEFLAVVKGTLRKLAAEGISQKSLMASLNYFEFKYREADYGSTPKGLMLGLQSLDSWLYGGDPMMHLTYQQTFDTLKRAVGEGYFENLVKECLLDNPFEAVVTALPEPGLTAKKDEELAAKLAARKAQLTKEEIHGLIAGAKALRAYQDEPSAPEELAKIPLLRREDIGREAEKFCWQEKAESGVKVLHHNLFTSGIGYVRLLFGTDALPQEDLCCVGLLKSLLGAMDTEHYGYADLVSELHLNSGGADFTTACYADAGDPEQFSGMFSARIRVLYDRLPFGCEMLEEILLHTDFSDEKRLLEIISEARSRVKMRLESSGHNTAVSRASSYFSATSCFTEATGGVTYYRFLEVLERDFESRKKALIEKLSDLCRSLFTKDNLMVSYTADEAGYAAFLAPFAALVEKLPQGDGRRYPFTHRVENVNEGLKTAGQVNYVARCGDFGRAGLPYTGALKILQVILNYDYLWLNLRVKGGAYGCMSVFGRSGEGCLVSYRDPNLAETNRVYEGIPAYLESFNPDERDMTKYVIGTISNLDSPLTPAAKGARGLSAYLCGVTDEMAQQERDEVLTAQKEDIRALAPIVRAVLETGSFCVVGSEQKIEENKALFGKVENLSPT